MSTSTISWPPGRVTHFHGRNGTGKMIGIEIMASEDYVDLQPITSRSRPANCHIELDREALGQVIEVLQAIDARRRD
jgi:hypothetical protein